MHRNPLFAPVLIALVAVVAAGCGDNVGARPLPPDATPPLPGQIKLRLLETTDLHVHIANYDYYSDRIDNTVGLANTAALIVAARAEATNHILVDNGDLIQGNPLGDYIARSRGLAAGEVHPVHKAMNILDYSVGNIGNHEFNYGLPFLEATLAGASFPYISANVFKDDGDDDEGNDEPYFTPYVIQDKTFTDVNGNPHTLKVGFIGFVPPQIMIWDRSHLEGKVIAKDIVVAAEKYVPEMKAAGADLVFAIPHSGLSGDSSTGMYVSTSYDLAGVDDIDAILFGHSHRVFPSADYEGVPEVDVTKGTIRGVPAVMAGFWGSHLGVIDLTLAQVDGAWQVVDSQSEARPIAVRVDGALTPLVEPNAAVLEAVNSDHMGALTWIRTPIGTIENRIHSYFARVQDDPSIQIVTDAQKAYVETLIQGTELDGLPVLSAGAPFKAGFGSPENYTDVPAGAVSIRNMADLYIYPNTVKVVKITGADVKQWLERSAGAFLQIDPTNVTTPQPLLDDTFPSYNFDVLDGVTYQIDVTEPSRYNGNGMLVAPDAERIKDLRFNGEPVTDEQIFLVATNNYRASGGGNFPGLGPDVIVIDAPDENRQVLANYIAGQDSVDPQADGNWSFAPIASDVIVEFETSPGAAALAAEFPRLTPGAENAAGYQVYRYDFSP